LCSCRRHSVLLYLSFTSETNKEQTETQALKETDTTFSLGFKNVIEKRENRMQAKNFRPSSPLRSEHHAQKEHSQKQEIVKLIANIDKTVLYIQLVFKHTRCCLPI
jgi:hypothetical protein